MQTDGRYASCDCGIIGSVRYDASCEANERRVYRAFRLKLGGDQMFPTS